MEKTTEPNENTATPYYKVLGNKYYYGESSRWYYCPHCGMRLEQPYQPYPTYPYYPYYPTYPCYPTQPYITYTTSDGTGR